MKTFYSVRQSSNRTRSLPVVQPVVHQEEPVPVVQQSWPGGSIDKSLLTRYHEHVARHAWFDE
ncbi:hypothetical protein A2U01_0070017, partial [Trifolium medium]|nr:hypothetical protein [Trifolium medium]